MRYTCARKSHLIDESSQPTWACTTTTRVVPSESHGASSTTPVALQEQTPSQTGLRKLLGTAQAAIHLCAQQSLPRESVQAE